MNIFCKEYRDSEENGVIQILSTSKSKYLDSKHINADKGIGNRVRLGNSRCIHWYGLENEVDKSKRKYSTFSKALCYMEWKSGRYLKTIEMKSVRQN